MGESEAAAERLRALGRQTTDQKETDDRRDDSVIPALSVPPIGDDDLDVIQAQLNAAVSRAVQQGTKARHLTITVAVPDLQGMVNRIRAAEASA
jgi:hypothetical protein